MNPLEGIWYELWRGIAIGIIISAPMGPVGILTIQRTLDKGRKTGFFTGVGATLSDIFYCLLTGFGLSFIEDFLKDNQDVIQIAGSAVLLIFGIYLFRSNPSRTLKRPSDSQVSHSRNILSGFLFTFSNPLIIFLIIGLFARFNFMLPELQWYSYLIGFLSIVAGALLWWSGVTYLVDKVRGHFNLRSMWLINRITGGIIMAFAVVGFVTAVSGLANASVRAEYFNSTRGFGPAGPPGAPLTISNSGADTLECRLPVSARFATDFTFRLTNRHNAPAKSYPYTGKDGKRHKVRHPGWSLFLIDCNGDRLDFNVMTTDSPTDEMTPPEVVVTTVTPAGNGDPVRKNSGLDCFCGENQFRFKVAERARFYGGNRTQHLLSETMRFIPVMAGISVAPGGCVEIDHITGSLSPVAVTATAEERQWSDTALLRERLLNPVDRNEGLWEVYDRQLEESMLRSGGDYRLAMLRDGKDYELIYVDGADKNPEIWRPGMVKARLVATPFDDVYDVVWLDAGMNPVPGDIKAQFIPPSLLSVSFASRSSALRLKRISVIKDWPSATNDRSR